MKTINKDKNYECLDCGGKFRGRVAMSIQVEGRTVAYKCPMCRSGRFKICDEQFEGELVWGKEEQ